MTSDKSFDLITRMGQVDLSQPRNPGYKPVSEGDILVGVMSENLQRLNHVRLILSDEADEIKSTVKNMVHEHYRSHLRNTKHDCDLFNQGLNGVLDKLKDAIDKFSLTDQIFWAMLHLEFPESVSKRVSLRDGNQVVYEKEDSIDNAIVNAKSALLDLLALI